MGGKHLKKLRAEKSKVHLKKKKLPKGQNVTDTAFKVKKILLFEQLKKVNEGEPVSNWNVPLKDLLIRLSHYNFTSRLNGLNGIKELLTNYPEIVQGPSIKPLVSRLLDLLTDEEHKIRTTAMNLLSNLFDMIPTSAVIPFHDVLHVHLGCAMTHRDVSVQRDSLNFINIMIKHSPEAVRHYFGTMARNFIRILKNLLSESHRMPSRGSKEDLEKSKTEMFCRLYQFLTAGFSEVTLANPSCWSKSIDITDLSRKNILLRESNFQYKKISVLSHLFINSENKSTTLDEKNSVEFQSVCSLIMPLIFETWMENCPDQKFSSGTTTESVLSDTVATLLCVLLRIVMLLHERSLALGGKMEDWFITTYSSAFKKCFVGGFPYLPGSSRKKSGSGKACESISSGFNSCVQQNLIICYLSYSFKLVLGNKDLGALLGNYISWALTRKVSTEMEMLLKVVKAVRTTSDEELTNLILGKLVEAYDSAHDPKVRRELASLLTKVVLDESESGWRKEQRVVKWMRCLPQRICETPVSVEVLRTVLQLVNRPEGEEVLREVEGRASQILENMPDLKMEGLTEFEGQRMTASILYRCSNKVIEELLQNKVLSSGSYPEKLREYITNIFQYKLTSE